VTTAAKAKWLRFLVLVLGGGTIPMQENTGLTHTEIGALLSINAIVATALFVAGGSLADRFEPRRLIPLGLISSGALGLYMATFPGFHQMMIVFGLLARSLCRLLLLPPVAQGHRNLAIMVRRAGAHHDEYTERREGNDRVDDASTAFQEAEHPASGPSGKAMRR